MRRASWSKRRSTGIAPMTGEGGSKREAEQDAAAKLLASRIGAMTTTLRLLRHHRRAECRQVHAVNALVGSKVAIVSPKVQTTRMPVRGVAIAGETQIVFVDTPGIFKPRRRLDRAMVNAAWAGADDADAVLLIVDAADLAGNADWPRGARHACDPRRPEERQGPQGGAGAEQDRRHEAHRSSAAGAKSCSAEGVFEDVFMISALKGDGVGDVASWVRGAHAAKARGFIRKIRPPTFPRAFWRRKSRARRSICACTTNLPYATRSRPRSGRSAKTARSRSTR